MEKPQYGLAYATAIAEKLASFLQPACERIAIAGSIRRKKETVGDIELLYVPRWMELPKNTDDLFAQRFLEPTNLVDLKLDELICDGSLTKRLNMRGSITWGEKNKLAVYRGDSIPVDFFSTDAESFENYLVCRTGPAELNMLIASRAIRRGWKWKPYSWGFVNAHDSTQFHMVKHEKHVFDFVELPWLEPHERTKSRISQLS